MEGPERGLAKITVIAERARPFYAAAMGRGGMPKHVSTSGRLSALLAIRPRERSSSAANALAVNLPSV
jgi:hypothetical protein